MAVMSATTLKEELAAAKAKAAAKAGAAQPATPTGLGSALGNNNRIVGGLDPETGKATTDVSKITADIASRDSTIMKRARTEGLTQANARGLLNSSMAVGAAQGQVLDRATAMGSQISDQRNQANLLEQEYDQTSKLSKQEHDQTFALAQFDAERETANIKLTAQLESAMRTKLAQMEISANDRRAAESMVTSMFELYQEQVRSIMSNPEIGASERAGMLAAAGELVQRQIKMTESLHGIDLNWSTGAITTNTNPKYQAKTDSVSSGSLPDDQAAWVKAQMDAEERRQAEIDRK